MFPAHSYRTSLGLTKAMVDRLLEHIDGPLPIVVNDGPRLATLAALERRKLVRFVGLARPKKSYVTTKGREVTAAVLAEMAEELIADGALDPLVEALKEAA